MWVISLISSATTILLTMFDASDSYIAAAAITALVTTSATIWAYRED